ncbi:hypothetical protein [Tropicibacter naphthalenivorans]|nr:hypothetical protein [Tropicibacter naphthalenivorans]
MYRCTFTGAVPDAGYSFAMEIADTANENPSLFVAAHGAGSADVWAAFPGEPDWMYMGYWAKTTSNCLLPEGPESPDAQANLGQDAWEICIH